MDIVDFDMFVNAKPNHPDYPTCQQSFSKILTQVRVEFATVIVNQLFRCEMVCQSQIRNVGSCT